MTNGIAHFLLGLLAIWISGYPILWLPAKKSFAHFLLESFLFILMCGVVHLFWIGMSLFPVAVYVYCKYLLPLCEVGVPSLGKTYLTVFFDKQKFLILL